jgi:cellulase (glycosyl hydrolase family 5)
LRKFTAVSFVCLLLSLVVVGTSSASPGIGSGTFTVGVTEDAPQGYDDGGLAMFTTMTGYGLSVDRMTVTWDHTQPSTITNAAALTRAIDAATKAGVKVVLSIATAAPDDGYLSSSNAYDAFAQFCVKVAQTFPQVQDIIIGNEPNKQIFNSPSWNGTQPVGAFNYEKELAAAYDALHAFNPNVDVVGLALAPRGSDPSATSNVGISPVQFINGMGQAYKASGRSAPIADNVSFHPYPNPNSADDPPAKGYQWPNAGVANLDRLEQAWWDAFNGTAQPLFQEDGTRSVAASGKSFVKWILDELGYQVPTPQPGYTDTENWKTVSEDVQAQYYAQIVSKLTCDPRVASLLIFHWIDETNRRSGFQSGFADISGRIRAAAAAVKSALGGGCTAGQTTWTHSTQVDGASTNNFKSSNGYSFIATANEDASFVATATPKSAASGGTGGGGKPKGKGKGKRNLSGAVLTTTGNVKAYLGTGVKFKGMSGPAGNYTLSITFKAAMNPARQTTLTRK